jgi:hypothetical protein
MAYEKRTRNAPTPTSSSSARPATPRTSASTSTSHLSHPPTPVPPSASSSNFTRVSSLSSLAGQVSLDSPSDQPKDVCPGFVQKVESIWSGYAYDAHELANYGWYPESLHPMDNLLTLRSASCQKLKGIWETMCLSCLNVKQSPKLNRFLSRAVDGALPRTRWKLLTSAQKESLLRSQARELNRLRSQVRMHRNVSFVSLNMTTSRCTGLRLLVLLVHARN